MSALLVLLGFLATLGIATGTLVRPSSAVLIIIIVYNAFTGETSPLSGHVEITLEIKVFIFIEWRSVFFVSS